MRGWRAAVLAASISPIAVACGTSGVSTPPASSSPPSFSSDLTCSDGHDPGGAGWDYGANPRGVTNDPVEWVRTHARGLDPDLTLSLIDAKQDDLDDLVIAWADGSVQAYIDFNVDEAGRYFPVDALACRASGIEDFA
jgi:hypothetical protein